MIVIDDVKVDNVPPGVPTDIVATVRMNAPVNHPVTITYRTSDDGAATANQDYRPVSATLTIPAGQTTATIPLRVTSDADPSTPSTSSSTSPAPAAARSPTRKPSSPSSTAPPSATPDPTTAIIGADLTAAATEVRARELDRLRGADGLWIAEVRSPYDGGPWNYGVTILEFRGDEVIHETIYGGEAWQAPDWRAPWRAAPPGQQTGIRGDDTAADSGGA